jgi:hypothetical protein
MNPEPSGFGCVGFFFGASLLKGNERSIDMLWTLALIFVLLWLLGIITSYTAGGLIHILLVVALVVIVIRLLQGRRPLT